MQMTFHSSRKISLHVLVETDESFFFKFVLSGDGRIADVQPFLPQVWLLNASLWIGLKSLSNLHILHCILYANCST